ncbi:MAG TPA: leucine-rich repeat protein [Ruminococcus flavefaciens]|nr:leucine-rich repeat protein [Ruminococcus flavefaciens]
MKKLLSTVAALSLLLSSSTILPEQATFVGMSAFADTVSAEEADETRKETIGDFVYEISDTEAKLCECNNKDIVDLVIPSEVNGLPVTEILWFTFSDMTSIRSVKIPDTIKHIDDFVFSGCTSLTDVKLPDNFESMQISAFTFMDTPWRNMQVNEDGYFILGSTLVDALDCTEENVVVPDGITRIAADCFSNTDDRTGTKIKSVSLPDSLKEIGTMAFCHLEELESIDIPDSVETIGTSAFSDCYKLSKANLPKSLKEISGGLFSNTAIEEIEIPESVKKIGGLAFCETRITKVVIPSTVEEVEDCVFNYCHHLEEIYYDAPELKYYISQGTPVNKVVLGENVRKVNRSVFWFCDQLSSITFLNPDCEIDDRMISCWIGPTGSSPESTTVTESKTESEAADDQTDEGLHKKDVKILTSFPAGFTGYLDDSNYKSRITICGFKGSTAELFADKNGYYFSEIDGNIVNETSINVEEMTVDNIGDANGDNEIGLADSLVILQNIANSIKYPLTEEALDKADVFNRGDGITANDALSIQKYDAKIISALPESYMK